MIFQPVSAIPLRTDGGLDDASVVLLVMLFDYLWRWWIIRSSDAVVEEVEVVRMAGGGGDINKLALSHPTLRITEPGQYCFLRIGQLGWLQWHPFSVASSPSAGNSFSGTTRFLSFGAASRANGVFLPPAFMRPCIMADAMAAA